MPRFKPQKNNDRPEPAIIEKPITFSMAWARLMKTIKFRILPSEYLGRKCYIKGRSYKIEGETVDNFFIAAFPNKVFPKVGNKYKISK